MIARGIVYTTLFGGYERLNEQPVAARSALAFVCFTDDPSLTSDTWDVRVVEPAFAWDPVRSARRVKILGPPLDDDPDVTLWIDNSVVLRSPPEDALADWLDGADIAAPLHSFRARVVDEFEAVLREERDDPGRVNEQLAHYLQSHPEVLELQPLWTAVLARRRTPAVERFNAVWYEHVLRYSRRDQLSVRMALLEAGKLPVSAVSIDNHVSPLHQWPVMSQRRQHDALRNPVESLRPLAARVHLLELALDDAEVAVARVARELDAVREQSHALVAANTIREAQLLQLEGELAELRAHADLLTHELDDVRQSETWRAGNVVVRALWPLRALRRRDDGYKG